MFPTGSTTLGIDLSAQPKETAVCVVEWRDRTARIEHLAAGADDNALLELVDEHAPQKVAIDSPFGWPAPFISTLVAFSSAGTWPAETDRRPLLFRRTDLAVREETGVDPLSVSSNLLAICAMRCARLLVALAGEGRLDRTGRGLVAEVYPAAALRQWQLDPRGYKGGKVEKVERRGQLVAEVADAVAPWLPLSPLERERLSASDHLLDALVSAIVGRAVALDATIPIPDEHEEAAASEGWIHLPRRQPLAEFDPFDAGR